LSTHENNERDERESGDHAQGVLINPEMVLHLIFSVVSACEKSTT
jgi:hypothetical protein